MGVYRLGKQGERKPGDYYKPPNLKSYINLNSWFKNTDKPSGSIEVEDTLGFLEDFNER